jgi:hypothetical protein
MGRVCFHLCARSSHVGLVVISDSSMSEACYRAGLTPWTRQGLTLWYLSTAPGRSGHTLDDPFLISWVATALRLQVGGSADDMCHTRWVEGLRRMLAAIGYCSHAFLGDITVICLAMYSLGDWEMDFCRVALGLQMPPEERRSTPIEHYRFSD